MVTTVTSYTDSRNRAFTGEGYDGVVRVSAGAYYGSGVLLYDGRAVLTAAHLFSDGMTAATVHFETVAGSQSISSASVTVLPNYDALNVNHDLALVWLTGSAPVAAERYNLYRGGDEIGQSMTMVGYGMPGTGSAGVLDSYSDSPIRLKASNQFDADAADLKSALGSVMGWTPEAGSQVIADFDNGTTTQDALGRLMNRPGTGLGSDEGLISPGDSGGPAFINGQIAGVSSYRATLSTGTIAPDIDGAGNSSYGEIGFWQRVGYYQQWIDQSMRAQYQNAPTKAADVQKSVVEGYGGISYAYFLLQFTGVRSNSEQKLSVDYVTRDGTAKAGEDYLATRGTLILYPNEDQAVISVEIRGDSMVEPDETFYLDVFNAVGGSFGEGVVKLTATRTIINDDGGLWG
jgi:secreted trypsin-like serine protease